MTANLPPDDEILLQIDAAHNRRTESVRAYLKEVVRLDLLADLDTKLREIRSGIDAARRTWEALSPVQRRVLMVMSTGRHLRRRSYQKSRYDAYGKPHAVSNVAGVATVRNLARRELVALDGGAFEPEAKAVLTERGAFVLKHGPADAGRAALQEGNENG